MKAQLLTLVFLATACGQETDLGQAEKTGLGIQDEQKEEQYTSFFLETSKHLPTCSESLQGALAYLKDKETFLACDAGIWNQVELTEEQEPSVIIDEIPEGSNTCPKGGVSIASERDFKVICNGVDGQNGADGEAPVVSVFDEPAGDNCSVGGRKMVVDGDAHYICDGANGSDGSNGADGEDHDPILSVKVAMTYAEGNLYCPGSSLDIDKAKGYIQTWFVDENRDGLRSNDDPTINAVTTCNGVQGSKGDKGDTGATGATGAAGADGQDGTDGQNGVDGSDGRSAGIRVTDRGDEVQVVSYWDDNNNGNLDMYEETISTVYIENGADGADGAGSDVVYSKVCQANLYKTPDFGKSTRDWEAITEDATWLIGATVNRTEIHYSSGVKEFSTGLLTDSDASYVGEATTNYFWPVNSGVLCSEILGTSDGGGVSAVSGACSNTLIDFGVLHPDQNPGSTVWYSARIKVYWDVFTDRFILSTPMGIPSSLSASYIVPGPYFMGAWVPTCTEQGTPL